VFTNQKANVQCENVEREIKMHYYTEDSTTHK